MKINLERMIRYSLTIISDGQLIEKRFFNEQFQIISAIFAPSVILKILKIEREPYQKKPQLLTHLFRMLFARF